MRKKTLVSIINWNDSSRTNECLSGITNIDKTIQPDVYLTDNNSQKEKLVIDKSILNSLKSITVNNNSTNKGFAGGHNDAIRYALDGEYDYVCLLNNDTEIIDSLVFEKLIDELEDNDNAVASAPTILSSLQPPTVWYGGGTMNIKSANVHHDNVGVDPDSINSTSVKQVSFLTGCCLMISLRDKTLDVLLSEDYFLYWEDTDWCARMLQNNKQLLYVPDAKILHNTSSSLGIRSSTYAYYNIRNRLLFGHRWSSLNSALPSNIVIGLKYIVLSLKRPASTPKTVVYVIKATIDGIRNVTGALK